MYKLILLLMFSSIAVVAEPVVASASGKTVITLKDEITTSSSTILLADVAEISRINPDLYKKLKNIVVMKSPRPGVLSVVSKADINSFISQKVKGAYNNIRWQGTGYVKVYAVGQTLEAEKLQTVASQFLESKLAGSFSDYHYQVNAAMKDINLPFGEVTLIPKLRSEKIGRRSCVWIDVMVNDQQYQSVPVWFSVNAYIDAPKLTKDVSANSYINSNNIDWVRTDISSLRDNGFYQKQDGDNFVFNRDVKAGELVLKTDVKKISDVMNGQVIEIEGRSGNVVVTVKGIAVNDGNIGEIVQVRSMNDESIFNARVINKATVMVGS